MPGRVERMRLEKAESRGSVNYELIWLLVAPSAAGLMWVLVEGLGLNPFMCPMQRFLGVPCPTCGGTRSTLALLNADWLHAWSLNPLVFAGEVVFIAWLTYAAAVVLLGAPRFRIAGIGPGQARFLRIFVIGAILLNWAYLVFFSPYTKVA